VSTRYKGKVADYEMFWAPTPSTQQYTELLKVVYTKTKAADPNATVIVASVAAAAQMPGGPTVNPVTHLSEMYATGSSGYFGAIAYHPYLYSIPFSAGHRCSAIGATGTASG
jgi:hypothetical protein